MKKIYLSGKMTGLQDFGKEHFDNAEKTLKELNPDCIIFNPIKISKQIANRLNKEIEDIEYHTFLKEDLKILLECDEVLMLENWQDSNGAIIEHNLAKDVGIEINYL